MQAYYEIETDIPENHQLNVVLPDQIPIGKAKAAVIYALPSMQENTTENTLKNFLESDFIGCAQGVADGSVNYKQYITEAIDEKFDYR